MNNQRSDSVILYRGIAITALVVCEFILPEDAELVSAVYAISLSKPLFN